jgi:hypothetical protein
MVAELQSVEVVKVETKSIALRDQAKAIVVRDQETHDAAAELYLGLSALEKEINAVHDPAISAAHASHKAALAAKAKSADPVAEAKKIIKPKITAWEDEQERIRQELERKAREEAQRKADEEARIAREAAEAEYRRLAAIEEEERLRLAAEAERAGATEEQVAEILETPITTELNEPLIPYIPPPVIMPTIAPIFKKTAGFTSRVAYSAEVVDLNELIRVAAGNRFFAQYLQVNQTAINNLARASKEAFTLPGCRLIKERV